MRRRRHGRTLTVVASIVRIVFPNRASHKGPFLRRFGIIRADQAGRGGLLDEAGDQRPAFMASALARAPASAASMDQPLAAAWN
jgi:hypothetical protein